MNINFSEKLGRILICVFICLTGLACAYATEVTANSFRNSNFRGFGFADVKYGMRSEEDLDALAKTGANIARIFVVLKRCEGCSDYVLPKGELETLDALVKGLAIRSIYALPVLEPVDVRGVFWTTSSLQKSYIEHWKAIALRYKDYSSIAAFDLMNEPVPPGKTYTERQDVWLNFAEHLAKSIREIDPSRVIVLESAPDSTPTSFENLRKLSIENVVYSFHSYLPISLTHQGVMKNYPNPVTYGSENGMDSSKKDLYGFLDKVANFAKKFDVPILVGEFSCVRWAPKSSALRYAADSIDYFEAKGWSWIYNDFRAWHGWDSEIPSEDQNNKYRDQNAPMATLLRSRFSKNK